MLMEKKSLKEKRQTRFLKIKTSMNWGRRYKPVCPGIL